MCSPSLVGLCLTWGAAWSREMRLKWCKCRQRPCWVSPGRTPPWSLAAALSLVATEVPVVLVLPSLPLDVQFQAPFLTWGLTEEAESALCQIRL